MTLVQNKRNHPEETERHWNLVQQEIQLEPSNSAYPGNFMTWQEYWKCQYTVSLWGHLESLEIPKPFSQVSIKASWFGLGIDCRLLVLSSLNQINSPVVIQCLQSLPNSSFTFEILCVRACVNWKMLHKYMAFSAWLTLEQHED